jgi:transposase InsO family protein
MDGRGRCLDNVFIERLWRSLKYELIYPGDSMMAINCDRCWTATSISTIGDVRIRRCNTGHLPNFNLKQKARKNSFVDWGPPHKR